MTVSLLVNLFWGVRFIGGETPFDRHLCNLLVWFVCSRFLLVAFVYSRFWFQASYFSVLFGRVFSVTTSSGQRAAAHPTAPSTLGLNFGCPLRGFFLGKGRESYGANLVFFQTPKLWQRCILLVIHSHVDVGGCQFF